MTRWCGAIALVTGLMSCAARPVEHPVVIVRDVVYGHKDGMALTLDAFRPTSSRNGAAVLVMISGGWVSRWTTPDSVANRSMIRALTDRGYTVFAVRHGSSPRYKVPEAYDDVHRALAFVHARADDFDIDPERLGVFGYSAGGHLSLMLGLHGDDGDDPAGAVRAVVAFFPPVDLRGLAGPSQRFPALDFSPALEADVSPLLYATADDPPTLLMHGDADNLVPVDHSRRMHDALEAAGVETALVEFPGAGHGFRGADQDRSEQLAIDWFERYLATADNGR